MQIHKPDFQHIVHWSDLLTPEQAQKVFGDDWQHKLALLDDRDRQLEDNILRPEITASYPGAITASISPPWQSKRGKTLVEFHVLLNTAGSGNTVIELQKNGTAVSTLTLGSSVTDKRVSLNVPWLNYKDVLNFEITTAGSGAEDLTAIARFI
jgi:hypothetical protein